jgi:hypothetical protein
MEITTKLSRNCFTYYLVTCLDDITFVKFDSLTPSIEIHPAYLYFILLTEIKKRVFTHAEFMSTINH